ncbi:transcriptional repressor [Acidovorax sp. BLS4]|uniref:Fur family transcriptional regulator n=1 Tax=Acidovorax sp. BLS4 TaxID=3273430 RepID=UPI002941E2CD|nr:transcriptional repressor [Paracidovorax avenae]WOI45090.1 transcriptional repressor [Paracidovorax avenae]
MPRSPHSDPSAPRALPPGLRSTRATRALLALMSSQPSVAVSGAEVESALARRGVVVNRVTVYRLLDRLASAGLMRRHIDAQRVARYTLVGHKSEPAAPHFECNDCHRQFPVTEGAAPLQAAARQMLKALASAGHDRLALDVAVRGRCAVCAQTAHPGDGE